MRTEAQTVIIGAGIVGISAAYYLAKGGMTDIVVVDRGPLFQTGGSTSHAPGGILQNNASRTVSKLAQWSVEMFFELSDEGERTYFSNGSLEVATTPERWADLHRKFGWARSWDLATELLTPSETGNLLPQLDTSLILGSIFIEGDGTLRSVPTVERLAKRAMALGVEFIGDTMVTGFDTRDGRIRAVETERVRITCEQALICGGIWGPMLGKMAGISIPLQPCAHPYIRTTPLPELAGTEGIVQPLWRHQDHSMYLWQDEERYGIGSYRHTPVIVDPEMIDNSTPAPADLPFDMTPLQSGLDEAKRLMPAIRDSGITDRVFGMFSFTPDGNSLVGESAVAGLWVAEAVWVTHGIGTGRAIAELMLTGDCELDLRDLDLNRFAPHAPARSYVRARGWQQYREVYDIIHPRDVIATPRGLRRSPFYDRQKELGAVFTESNGWERPLWFEANAALPLPESGTGRAGWAAYRWSPIAAAEHLATRTGVALYDFSTFTKIDVSGSNALPFLGSLSCTDLDRPVGRANYALFLNTHGGIESDVTILRLADDSFRIFAGAASGPRDLAYLKRQARRWSDVAIADVTSASVALGLWGPNAQALIDAIAECDLSPATVPSFTSRDVFIAGIPVRAIRMSYAGEDGFELHVATEYGAALWDAIWEAGHAHGLVAAGLTALDSLRLECGYRGLGTDLRADRTLIEAGLGFAVSKQRTGYVGCQAIHDTDPVERLSLLVLDNPDLVLMGKEPVLSEGQVIGYITSANFGYTTGASLALAYLPASLATPGSRLEVEYFGVRSPATVTEEPLIAPKRTVARRGKVGVG